MPRVSTLPPWGSHDVDLNVGTALCSVPSPPPSVRLIPCHDWRHLGLITEAWAAVEQGKALTRAPKNSCCPVSPLRMSSLNPRLRISGMPTAHSHKGSLRMLKILLLTRSALSPPKRGLRDSHFCPQAGAGGKSAEDQSPPTPTPLRDHTFSNNFKWRTWRRDDTRVGGQTSIGMSCCSTYLYCHLWSG